MTSVIWSGSLLEDTFREFLEGCKRDGMYYADLLKPAIILGEFKIYSEDIGGYNPVLLSKLTEETNSFEIKHRIFNSIIDLIKSNYYPEKPFTLTFTEPLSKFNGGINPDQKIKLDEDVNADGSPLPVYENDLKNVHGLVGDKIMTLDHYTTIPATGQVYKYEKGVYLDYEQGINNLVNIMIRYSKDSNRKEVFSYIKAHTEKCYDEFDADPNIHNLKNTLLNIETMETKLHTPDYLSLRQFNVEYIPDAKCPEYDAALEDNIPDPVERQMFLECLAMCLIPEFNFKKAGVFYGPSNAGKSSLVAPLEKILGEDNISSYSLQDFDNDRFACGGLIGKFANITHDMGHEKITRIHKFKNIADHKPVETEKKYGHAQNIAHKISCIFLANHLPEVTPEASEGFFSRIILLEFKKTYVDNPSEEELARGVQKIDRDRIIKINSELPGIYLKLLDIAKKMKEQKHFTYTISSELVEQQWLKLDQLPVW